MHYAFNRDCKAEAQVLSSFGHLDPGVQSTATNLFHFPLPVLQATFGCVFLIAPTQFHLVAARVDDM